MSNKREQLEKEISHIHSTMELITECFEKGKTNEDNDLVLSEADATRIKFLLGEC